MSNVFLKSILLAAAASGALCAHGAHAQSYVVAGEQPVRSGDGHCWRTGYWTAAAAREDCDPRAVNIAVAPTPAAQSLAALKPVHYSTEVLFAFDDDVLTPAAREELDSLAQKLTAMEIEKVVAVGHSDGVGAPDYNKRLSARRAKAVGDYLGGKGVSAERLQLVAMGKHDPVTAGACDGMALDGRADPKIIACLQPDRRVKVELMGREKARD